MSPDERATMALMSASGPEGAAILATLHRELFTPAWSGDAFAALLAEPGSIALLAESGGEERVPIAFILGRIVVDEAEILSVGVARSAQRRGIGSRLVSALARLAAERGATRLFLEVAADNAPARQLYRAQGFSEAGRRPGYYERPGKAPADAVIMSKTIDR